MDRYSKRLMIVLLLGMQAAGCGGGSGGGSDDAAVLVGPQDAAGGGPDAASDLRSGDPQDRSPIADSGQDAVPADLCSRWCGGPSDPWECGEDGCGGTCGECPLAAPLCVEHMCQAQCVAQCAAKQCGPDGCGGLCGECPVQTPDCVEGLCTIVCLPDCAGKECGQDGCGGSCGTCPQVAPLCVDNLCQLVCTPDCDGLECGDDGCAGSCGDCPETLPVCEGGVCVKDPATVDDCAEEAKQIFLVSESGFLLRYEPAQSNIVSIGPLKCNAGWGVTPYSMSVDRNSNAWVLYGDGSLWKVDTADASCSATGFAIGQLGFEIFGMGFSTDGPDTSDETLFVAGGPLWDMMYDGDATLGSIDTETLELTSVSLLEAGSGLPELTGNRSGELWGFFPKTSPPRIARIDKMTAAQIVKISLPANLFADVQAWAFANWGGSFYIFFKSNSAPTSGIWRVLPGGDVFNEVADTGYVITGAGVSTCAPVEENP